MTRSRTPVGRALAGLLLAGCAREAPGTTLFGDPPPADSGRPPVPSPAPAPPDPGPTRAVMDRDRLPAELAAIGAAVREVRVAMYVVYEDDPVDDLLDALAAAARRGVAVRFLADEEGDETAEVVEDLLDAGVEARLDDPTVTLHAKLLVADDVAIVGSHNWTWSALSANREGSALVADAELASWYAAWFDGLWAGAPATPAPLARDDLRPLADREVLDAVLGCVEGAEVEVDVTMYAIAWDDRYPGSEVDRILLALEAAHARGVAVRVVVDGSDWIVDHAINDAAVARLRAAGIPVWRASSSQTHHAKVLRCDGTALVSDANWSYSTLGLAHGASLRATAPALVGEIAAWIAEVRADATPVE